MKPFHRVVRNSAWAVASEATGGALFFLAFVLIARYLAAYQFGVFSFLLALVALCQVAADFGITTILVRDMARDKPNAPQMCATAAALVGIVSLGLLTISGLLAYGLAASPDLLWTCWIMAVAAALSFQSAVFAAVCRAHEDMGLNAAGNVTHRLVLVLCAWIGIALDAGLAGIALAYLGANLCQALFFYSVVRKRYFAVRWRLAPRYSRRLLAQALPVGIATVLRRSTILAGTLFLSALSTPYAVGLFNAALRIMQIIELLPSTLALPLLPPFSRLGRQSGGALFQALGDAMRIFAVIGFPVCTWALLAAPQLMRLTFGAAYDGAAPALQLMSLAIFLIFPTSLYLTAFSALGQQQLQTLASAICLGTAVALNIALVPLLEERGAAIALVTAELVFFVTGFVLLRRQGFTLSLPGLFGKPLLATGLASLILVAAPSDSVLALLASALAYGCVYVVLIVGLKGIRKEELASLRSAFQSRLNL